MPVPTPTGEEGSTGAGNRTLQLRLSLSSSNTSFKRSFEELFGGAESDGSEENHGDGVGGHESDGIGAVGSVRRDGRNKRQRSGDCVVGQSSAGGSAGGASSSAAAALTVSLPPRLPTPRLEDVHMADIPLLDHPVATGTSREDVAGPSEEGSGLRSGVLQIQQSSRSATSSFSQHAVVDATLDSLSLENQYATTASMPSGALSLRSNSPPPLLPPVIPGTPPTPVRPLSPLVNPSPRTSPSLVLAPLSLSTSSTTDTEERYRVTMERYNAFESNMAALRRSVSPPPPRSILNTIGVGVNRAASPPRLPPLELSSLRDDEDHGGDEDHDETHGSSGTDALGNLPRLANNGSIAHVHVRPDLSAGRHRHMSLGESLAVDDESLNDMEDEEDDDEDDEDEELDELDQLDEEDEDRGSNLYQHHQHLRHHDAPPRIELSNSLWSSLSTGVGVGGEDQDDDPGDTDDEGGVGARTDNNNANNRSYPDPPPFRDRLDSALEALRSPSSPLVPGLVPGNRDRSLNNENSNESNRGNEEEEDVEAEAEVEAELLTASRSGVSIASTSSLQNTTVNITTADHSTNSTTGNNNGNTTALTHPLRMVYTSHTTTSSPASTSTSTNTSTLTSTSASASSSSSSISGGMNTRTAGAPPTLPPIVTDTDTDEMWRRDLHREPRNVHVHVQTQIQMQPQASTHHHLHQVHFHPRTTTMHTQHVHHHHHHHNHAHVGGDVDSGDTGRFSFASASVHAHERRAMQMQQQQQQQQQQQRQRLGLGEVEVPSPSLSGFYDWLEGASANVADANGHGNTGNSDVGLGSRQSGSGSGNGSGSGSGNGNGIWALAMGARERTGIGEERRSLEDALAGWLRNDREIDPELPLRGRDSIPASSRPGSGFSATATRPTDENVGMDVDMESDTEREREVERLPWTLGSSTTSSASRSNHHRPPPLNLNLNHEVRRSQRSMPEEYRRLNLLHDTDDGEWNPLHAPVPWQAEPTFGRTSAPSPRAEFPSGSASFSRPSPRPPYSSNLFSPSSPGLPPPTPTFPSLSGRLSSTTAFDSHTPASSSSRIRLPRFMSSAFPENRGPRGSLPPSLELDLGLNNSVFGEDGEGAGGAGIDVAMSNNNDNNSNNSTMAAASQFGVGSGGSSYSRREPSMRLFERPELPPLPPSQSHSQQARNHFQHTHRNPNLDVDDRRRDWRAAAYGGRRDGERSRERETQRQPRYHTTRVNVVGSSNSLVAENAAEMDRRLARADLVRRLSASRRVSGGEEASSSSESGSGSNNESVEGRGTNVNVGPGSGLSGPGVSVPRVEGAGIGPAWERVARLRREAERLGRREGGEESGRSHGPLGARPRTPSQTHTTAQSGIQTRFGHLLSRSHGPSNRGAAGGGGGRGGAAASYGTFGGLGLPPRVGNGSNGGSEMRGSGSESNDDVGSSGTRASMYPGVAPPAPRPRLHSTRHMPSLSSLESAGPDHTLDGHRRSTSWSQGSLNGNPNADADSGGTRSMSTQEDIATMFGLRLPLDGSSHTQSSTHLYHSDSESGSGPVVEEQAQRRTRTSFDSVSSSDSSMSVESLLGSGSGNSNASVYGSGSTPAPSYGRAMFLNPELPSPGLGGLFDTPGSGPGAASQQSDPSLEPLEYPPPGAPSRLASSLTFNSSNSSGFFSSVGRFTPSPVRSSDDDAEDGFVNETMSLESMMDRFGSAREGVLNLPRHVRNRDGYYEGPLDEMDIDGDQRDRGSSTTTDFPGRLATERPPIRDLRRQDLFPPAPRPSAISTSNTGSSNASSTSSDRRNNIIDPNLFAPGPFRNTMATLALRTREYTAQASSPTAAARPGTTIPSPITPFSPSSSLSPPPTYRFARPIQRGTATQGSGSGSAHSHSPPVIPPLSFENDTANQNQNGNESESNTASSSGERSEVQEPLGAVTRRWVRETGEIANNPRFADALRQYYEERRRRGRPEQSNESLGSEDSSVGSPSSVESRSASWLHLQATRREMAERVERRRALEGLPEWDALAPRQAHQNSSANTSTSANANASASAGDRPNPRLPNTNWHEVVWNPAIVGDGWVDTESDSDDDSIDFMLFGSNEGGVGSRTEMEPVPPAVPRGPREAWRLDGTTGPRRNRFQNNNSNNDTGGGSGNGTSAAGRARTGPGTEERGSGRPALMPRLFRERMIDRLRANAAAVAAGAPMGMTGRFGGFTRRTGELGDYVVRTPSFSVLM
ncbi:hypothetical protein P691DRAFT_473319 [Macrolepiota fuliginosa MF-IS2]|uniref:Uncharacterized protein n=1 Tax=Macrolepiota fuliginosa MF-IS2 TaxID=1400762 RepID=A0A9P6C620_9AGAR|nr:hypothetical protein P691DRAFT_473319 [Macrolepiota fuliginosa MF-IS2]